MTKPTVSTEWANDGAALVAQPDGAQRDFGWSTSDNTINGTPVKPNLQNQNGWQNNVHLWFNYFEQLLTPAQIRNLWEWEMPLVTTIRNNAGALEIVSTGSITEDQNEHNYVAGAEIEFLTIGHWLEANNDFNRGVGLQMIDGSAVVWDILPVAGTTDIAWETLSLSGNVGFSSVDDDCIFHITPNAKIEIYKDGVLTADFSTFSILSSKVNIDTANPTGLRGIFNNDDGYGLSIGLKRKRFRALGSCQFDGILSTTEHSLTIPCKLVGQNLYKFQWVLGMEVNIPNSTMWFYNNNQDPTSPNDQDDYLVFGTMLQETTGFSNRSPGATNDIYPTTLKETSGSFMLRARGPTGVSENGLTLYAESINMGSQALGSNDDPLEFVELVPLSELCYFTLEDV
jgi:hypothetical protein